MPGKTRTFTVTDAADVPVTAQTYTEEITVAEDPSVVGWPTSSFIVKKPTSGDTAIRKPHAASYQFRNCGARPGDIVGYVTLPSGAASTTFQQDEL